MNCPIDIQQLLLQDDFLKDEMKDPEENLSLPQLQLCECKEGTLPLTVKITMKNVLWSNGPNIFRKEWVCLVASLQ